MDFIFILILEPKMASGRPTDVWTPLIQPYTELKIRNAFTACSYSIVVLCIQILTIGAGRGGHASNLPPFPRRLLLEIYSIKEVYQILIISTSISF
jgi:hypothetical protein